REGLVPVLLDGVVDVRLRPLPWSLAREHVDRVRALRWPEAARLLPRQSRRRLQVLWRVAPQNLRTVEPLMSPRRLCPGSLPAGPDRAGAVQRDGPRCVNF